MDLKREVQSEDIIQTPVSNSIQYVPLLIHKSNQQKNRKQLFQGSFKQAVFLNKGNDDGSSQLHVSFTSSKTPTDGPRFPAASPKAKVKVAAAAKEVAQVDKKKALEEIYSLPKPETILIAERELLSIKGLVNFHSDWAGGELYSCEGCHDKFPSQFTLQDHLERQSYSLSLDCPECQTKLMYTNKCQMYVHLLSHFKSDYQRCAYIVETCTSLTILPRTQLRPLNNSLLEEPDISGQSTEDIQSTSSQIMTETETGMEVQDSLLIENPISSGNPVAEPNNASSSCTTEAAEKAADSISEKVTVDLSQQSNLEDPVSDDAEEETENLSFTCTECLNKFETEWALRTHFTLPCSDQGKSEICVACRVELPTPCSYKAHVRLHGIIEPFTCPDCGIHMSKKNIFLKHLRLQCLHYSKLSEFPCPGCPESFCHAEEQLKHLHTHPLHMRYDGERSYYKCNRCPKAFKSIAAHSKHEGCPDAGCTVVHMCNNCPQQTVFRSWTELIEHRAQTHPNLKWTPKRTRIFACYLCDFKTRAKQGFLDHLLKSHGKKSIEQMCYHCGVEVDTVEHLDIHKQSCLFKNELMGNKLKIIAERKPKLSSSSSVTSEVSLNNTHTDVREVTSAKDVNWQQENITYLSYSPSFSCHICTVPFSNYANLRDHVIRSHEGRGMIYECWLCRDRGNTANFYRQSALDKHMIDTHKMMINSCSFVENNFYGGSNDASQNEPHIKKMKIWSNTDDAYECCRCGFVTKSGEDFREHIKEHKSQTDIHQCAECGMCFPVQLALRRHLYAVHKVSDYVKYSRHQYMVEYGKQLSNTQGKCPVCEKKFDEDFELRRHLRTHGMVYINTKRLPVH